MHLNRWLAIAVMLACLGTTAQAAEPPPSARREIDHLLDYLGRSACEFYRNGTWHGAAEARDHLQTKLEYLLKKGHVSTAEEFIERAATKSSMSGKPYQVRCAPAAAVPSSDWLRAELARYRARPGETASPISTVVWTELTAPPALNRGGRHRGVVRASHNVNASCSPKAYQNPCSR